MNTIQETEMLSALPEIRELEPSELNEVTGGKTTCTGIWIGKILFIGSCSN